MPESDRLAIAAHLHVLLRRKTGRVTDTEWMAANAIEGESSCRLEERAAYGRCVGGHVVGARIENGIGIVHQVARM